MSAQTQSSASFGVVGLGVMGSMLALNLAEKTGENIAGFELDPGKAKAAEAKAAEAAGSALGSGSGSSSGGGSSSSGGSGSGSWERRM